MHLIARLEVCMGYKNTILFRRLQNFLFFLKVMAVKRSAIAGFDQKTGLNGSDYSLSCLRFGEDLLKFVYNEVTNRCWSQWSRCERCRI